jgi:hypothetical protein
MHGKRQELDSNEQHIQPLTGKESGELSRTNVVWKYSSVRK